MGACPVTYGMTCRAFTGSGARACTTAGRAAARCGAAGTEELKVRPFAVAVGGATMVTLVTFVTLVMLVLWMLVTFVVTRMPTATTGGALVTTAGAVPTGAGMMMPRREPGGAGTKQPSGPIGCGPGMTPTAGVSTTSRSPGAGATKATPGADQYPLMKIT